MSAIATPAAAQAVAVAYRPRPRRLVRALLYAFLTTAAALWLAPVAWAFYTSLRDYSETARYGYVSLPHQLTLVNYVNAWTNADLPLYFKNSLIITLPAVVATLFLSSLVAFVVSRYSFRLNVLLLVLFTAGNLLPQQVIITPLFRMYLLIPVPTWISESGTLYDSYLGVILINVAFQMGFVTFVLSNYMRNLPVELSEAALIDGAPAWRHYWSVILPLCRPPLAALATLLVTWIYNDFFWALVLMRTGSMRPITSALNNLQGQYFTNNNLVAAGALLVAVPTIAVYFALQRHFVAGLTLGANKG